MIAEEQGIALFSKRLDALYLEKEGASQEILGKLRKKAWEQFSKKGMPTTTHEKFRYIRLNSLFSNAFTLSHPSTLCRDQVMPSVFPECKHSYIVMVNGYFNPELSDLSAISSSVVVTDFSRAIKTYSTFFNNRWAESLKSEEDPFALLNAALYDEGIFVYLPPKTVVETPIQIIHFIDTTEKALLSPRQQFFIGARSEVDIYETIVQLSGSGYLFNCSSDFVVEEAAHVRFTQTAHDIDKESWVFNSVKALCKAKSRVKTIAVSEGSITSRYNYEMNIVGEEVEVELDGVSMLREKLEAHSNVLVDHQAPNCRSRQLFKTVLRDGSRSSFEGKILVHQEAQKTDAFQLNNNLLLSPDAHVDSKPNLEIFADDVKASHGATIGRLNEEQLFYMKSRGFSDRDAKRVLIDGFCREVMERVALPSLRKELEERAERYLG